MRLKRVIEGIDWQQPAISWIYTALIAAVGLQIARISFHDWLMHGTELVFFAMLVAVAECMHVRLPHVNGYVSVASAICLASMFAFGGTGAAFVAAVGTFVANIFWAAIPLDAAIFNAGQLAITGFVGGTVWVAAGGQVGTPLLFPRDLLPLLAAIGAYALLNVSLATLGIALAMRKPVLSTWLASVRWSVPNYAGLGPLGVLAIEIYYSSLSMFGILLLWIPLMFARYSFQQYWEIRRAHVKTIEALALALDARDPYTSGHSERVALYASAVATQFKLPDNDVEQVHFASILHDIGKIGISDFVLNKKGSLNQAEFALIQAHPGIGADMVKFIGFLTHVGDLIRHHHERYDGTGYPDRLSGQSIPVGARIISVADAFDAMTCDRVYRPALAPEEAIARLKAGKGTQFDPELVDCFITVWETVFDHGRKAPLPARKRDADGGAAGKALVEDVALNHNTNLE